MGANTTTVTDANFDAEIKSAEGAVLVDFWAEWCGPCRAVAPVLEEIAGEHEGALTIAKLNVDENPELAQRFGVMSIPTMILFKDGEATDLRIVGAKSKAGLLNDLQPYLA